MPTPEDDPTSRPGPVTVLLVDDEDGVREYVRRALELAGYRVLDAASADAAERLFRADPGRVGLLLTDVIMPGRCGTELARDLRTLRPDLPVLFTSGYVYGPLPLPDGAELLEKPFAPDALAAAVRRALAG
jgi:DNA-binding NtrC family response regulator